MNARLFKPFELFIVASLYYLLLTTIWSIVQAKLEASLGERKMEQQRPGMFKRLLAGGAGLYGR